MGASPASVGTMVKDSESRVSTADSITKPAVSPAFPGRSFYNLQTEADDAYVRLDLAAGGREMPDRSAAATLRVSPFLRERQLARMTDGRDPKLPHLNLVNDLVGQDAETVESKTAQSRSNMDGINTQIAKMRQDLRGKFVQKVPLLSLKVLSKEEQYWLVAKLRPWNFEPGDPIIQEGEIGDKLFIIERGTCEVFKEIDSVRTRLCRIEKGDFFGELAVMYDMPRSATVIAQTSVTVLSLSRDDIFTTVSQEKVDKMKVLARTQVFSSIPLLAKIDTDHKVIIASHLKSESWSAGSRIFRENQRVEGPTRRLYIVEQGSCGVETHPPEVKQQSIKKQHSVFSSQVSVVQPGSHFGMLEMVYGCAHHVTLTAVTDVSTLSISFDELHQLLGSDADEIEAVMTRSVRTFLIQRVHPLLRQSTHDELGRVLDAAIARDYSHWEVIFKKGDTLNQIYVLEKGVCIEYNGDAGTLAEDQMDSADVVEHSRPGETFTTECVISQPAYVAPCTLVAIAKCSFMNISKESLATLPKFQNSELVAKK